MSKSISSFPKSEKISVISRRIKQNTGGLGYWAAVDAKRHLGEVKTVPDNSKEKSPEETPETPLDS